MRKCRLLAVILALTLLPAAALAGIQEYVDESGNHVYSDAMTTADIIVGYLAVDSATINPFSCTQCDLVSMNALVYESLVELDDEMKPKALLAENWSQSDDGKTWTFTLRQGIQFHNGEPFTAYDVVASYQRHLNTGEANPYYGRINDLIESIVATDDNTVVVTARYPGYITLYGMTFPIAEESTVYDEVPRGTGPYWLIQYDMDSAIRLEANPLWWKQQPKVRSILFVRQEDTSAALGALQTGAINMLSTHSSTAALSRRLSQYTSLDYPTTTYEMLVPNLRAYKVTSDVNIRRAVMYAMDTAAIVSNAYLGMAQRGEVPVESTSWVYESQSAMYYYSPERALGLLMGAGWQDLTGDGMLNRMEDIMLVDLSMTILTYNEPGNTVRETAANMIAKYLNAVGVKTQVEVLTKSKVLSRIEERDYDLALIGATLSEVPSLVDLFYLGRKLNLNNYSTEDMENALMATYTARSETEFVKAMSDLQLLAAERLPVLGIGFRTGTLLSTNSLGGMSGNRLYDAFNGMEFVSVAGH